MDVTFVQGGEPLAADPFQADSYLLGAQATEQGGSITLTFDDVGPLVSLLGQGAAPESPLTLTQDDLLEIVERYGGMKADAVIHVDDEVDTSTITYDVESPAMFVRDMLLSAPMDLDMVSATGARQDLGQDMATLAWDVQYVDASNALDGVIEVEVVGGAFDFHVRYDYLPVDPWPVITITCLE